MEPYEGREPYIFISYARRDSDRAMPLLEALSGAGYRVWYDAGIQAGEHWTETLVEKVENCAVFCPLFSEAFSDSRFCFEETDYAYRRDKTIVPLYLEALKPDGLRPLYRLLQARQDVRLYEYADAAEFAERLGRESAFAPCKAPEWNKTGEIQWKLSADGVLTIARNEDWWNDFGSIPPYQIDPIHNCSTAPWMPYRKKIYSVEVTEDINAIGDHAFCCCESLTYVSISDNVTEIGDGAFYGCESLTDARIPYGVTQIGDSAFAHCKSLTSARIPDGIIEISARTFLNCKSLKRVRIPDGVTVIGDWAFHGCESLTNMRIPDGVTKIGFGAFKCCASLTNARIPDSVTEIGDWAFRDCKGLTNIRIPEGVTKIGGDAFWDCENLKSVEIPAGAEVDKHSFDEHTRVILRAPPRQ